MQQEILLLGDERLYAVSGEVERDELPMLKSVVEDMHDTLLAYREKHGAGRAIAAPQIGVFKRLIYQYIDEPVVMLNPVLHFPDGDTPEMDVLDDCMSFPGLYVKVKRHRRCHVGFRDMAWNPCRIELEGDLAELVQHEYDHLDGILATMRAVHDKAFVMKTV